MLAQRRGDGRQDLVVVAAARTLDEAAQDRGHAGHGDLLAAIADDAVLDRGVLQAEHLHLLAAGAQRQRRHHALHQLDVGRRPRHQGDALIGQLAPAEARVHHAHLQQRVVHRGDRAAHRADRFRGDVARVAHKERAAVDEPAEAVHPAQLVHEFGGRVGVEPAVDRAFDARSHLQGKAEAAGEFLQHVLQVFALGIKAIGSIGPVRGRLGRPGGRQT